MATKKYDVTFNVGWIGVSLEAESLKEAYEKACDALVIDSNNPWVRVDADWQGGFVRSEDMTEEADFGDLMGEDEGEEEEDEH